MASAHIAASARKRIVDGQLACVAGRGNRQAARRVCVAKQDGGKRLTAKFAKLPCLNNGVKMRRDKQVTKRPAVEMKNNGPAVQRKDGARKFLLAAGKVDAG